MFSSFRIYSSNLKWLAASAKKIGMPESRQRGSPIASQLNCSYAVWDWRRDWVRLHIIKIDEMKIQSKYELTKVKN